MAYWRFCVVWSAYTSASYASGFRETDVGTWDKLALRATGNFNEALRLTKSWSGLLSANATRPHEK